MQVNRTRAQASSSARANENNDTTNNDGGDSNGATTNSDLKHRLDEASTTQPGTNSDDGGDENPSKRVKVDSVSDADQLLSEQAKSGLLSGTHSTPAVSAEVQRHVDKIIRQSQQNSGIPNMAATDALAHFKSINKEPLVATSSGSTSQHLDTSTETPVKSHNDDQSSSPTSGSSANKPATGSEEWHKMRRDNHKEVERRRRENINRGINLLAEIVPDCEKQKGRILEKAHEYILKLKNQEAQNLEKWTLERLLNDQAIAELSTQNKALKAELSQAWRECDQWKKAATGRGITLNQDQQQSEEQQQS